MPGLVAVMETVLASPVPCTGCCRSPPSQLAQISNHSVTLPHKWPSICGPAPSPERNRGTQDSTVKC